MEEFIRLKKKNKILSIFLGIFVVLGIVLAISLEFLSEIEALLYVFVVVLGCVAVFIPLIILLYKQSVRMQSKLIEYLNKELPNDYQYQGTSTILDLVDDSLYPYEKGCTAMSQDAIIGNIKGTAFEYYLCTIEKDSLFSVFSNQKLELYIFKDINLFYKDFFITDKKIKPTSDFTVTPYQEVYELHSKDTEPKENIELPKDLCFMSVHDHHAYVFKYPSCKKAIYLTAQNQEDFKRLLSCKIEKIEKTYNEIIPWVK